MESPTSTWVVRTQLAALCSLALGAFHPLAAQSGKTAHPSSDMLPIVELRQYTLYPGKRDAFIALFEREFIESQEAVGMKIVGTFRDLDRPDHFVWLRAFKDMPARGAALNTFYYGPVWQAHRNEANPMLLDNDDVLLLHSASPNASFTADAPPRAARGATAAPGGIVIATIYDFAAPVGAEFIDFFEHRVRPQLDAAGVPVLASFVTETTPNNFPRLVVREKDHVFVWFSRFADVEDYEHHLALLTSSPGWGAVEAALRRQLTDAPQRLRLQPTPRSQLHD